MTAVNDTFSHIQTIVDPAALLNGMSAGWQAPVGVFDARHGFGRSAWMEAVPTTMLSYRLSGAPVTCLTRASAGRRSGPRRNIGFQPAGTPNDSVADGPIRFAQIYIPAQLLDRVGSELGLDRASGRLRDDLWFFADDELDHLVRTYILRSAAQDQPATRLEMEARSLLMLERLITVHHVAPRTAAARGGLTNWQERRACEHLRAHLAETVTLDELAGLASLSAYHFSRMFKRSTGLPPHAYQRRLRCERAKELLSLTDLTVGEIASQVGYETPQAFARMFRAETGASPSEYRRERR